MRGKFSSALNRMAPPHRHLGWSLQVCDVGNDGCTRQLEFGKMCSFQVSRVHMIRWVSVISEIPRNGFVATQERKFMVRLPWHCLDSARSAVHMVTGMNVIPLAGTLHALAPHPRGAPLDQCGVRRYLVLASPRSSWPRFCIPRFQPPFSCLLPN